MSPSSAARHAAFLRGLWVLYTVVVRMPMRSSMPEASTSCMYAPTPPTRQSGLAAHTAPQAVATHHAALVAMPTT